MKTEVVDLIGDVETVYKLELEGVPNAQARPRRGVQGCFYNPNKKAKEAFKQVINRGMADTPIFKEGLPVAVEIKFYMKRPNSHFKSNNRLKGLKALVPFWFVASPDIDNLAKFVLDGMNKLVYEDDRQVSILVVHKLFDSNAGCNGRTVIEVKKLN